MDVSIKIEEFRKLQEKRTKEKADKWADIPFFENDYEISNTGKIRRKSDGKFLFLPNGLTRKLFRIQEIK